LCLSNQAKKGSKKKSLKAVNDKIKTYVKSEISRTIENKSRQFFQNTYALLYSSNSAALLDGSIIPLTPFAGVLQIDQGVGSGGRVGNQVKVKKLMFKGTIIPGQYDAILNTLPQPLQIKLWLFYDKRDPTLKPTPSAQNNFFQFNDSNVGFSNTLADLWKPVNTDIYRILGTKVFKLGNAINTSAGSQTVVSGWSNNDFQYNCNFSIDCTDMIVKNIKFNDNNSNPTTRGLFALFECVYANGGSIGSGQRVASIQYMIDMIYEDA